MLLLLSWQTRGTGIFLCEFVNTRSSLSRGCLGRNGALLLVQMGRLSASFVPVTSGMCRLNQNPAVESYCMWVGQVQLINSNLQVPHPSKSVTLRQNGICLHALVKRAELRLQAVSAVVLAEVQVASSRAGWGEKRHLQNKVG